jgi:hypothetical protein
MILYKGLIPQLHKNTRFKLLLRKHVLFTKEGKRRFLPMSGQITVLPIHSVTSVSIPYLTFTLVLIFFSILCLVFTMLQFSSFLLRPERSQIAAVLGPRLRYKAVR